MKNSRIFTFVLILLVLLLGAASVYMYMKWRDDKGKLDTMTAEFAGLEGQYTAVTSELKNNQESQSAEKLATKYDTLTLLGKCGVGLSYPDEMNRYDPFASDAAIDGVNRAWRLHHDTVEKINDLDKNVMIGADLYYLILRNDNEASGYVSSYLSVECKENKEAYTTETFTTKYLDMVKKENKEVEALSGVKASTLTVKKDETLNKFGIEVNKVTIQRNSMTDIRTETGYIFVHKNKYYYIYSLSMTTEKKALRSLDAIIKSIYVY